MAQSVPKLKRLDKPAQPDSYGISNSPIGYMIALWQGDLLIRLTILPAGAEEMPDPYLEEYTSAPKRDDARAKTLVKSHLFPANEWQGEFPNEVQIGFYGTDFQWQAMQAMNKILKGKTLSYAQLATQAKAPGASRAAGSACAKNPVPLIIPCHRILTSAGKIGGYAYGTALKRQLLRWEDVQF